MAVYLRFSLVFSVSAGYAPFFVIFHFGTYQVCFLAFIIAIITAIILSLSEYPSTNFDDQRAKFAKPL